MKVLLVPNYSNMQALECSSLIESYLSRQGVSCIVAPDNRPQFQDSLLDDYEVELVISLGGDGTLLRAARIVGYQEIPILALSFGHLGFLTVDTQDNVLPLVERALAGELHQSRRSTLAIEVQFDFQSGKRAFEKRFALNDLALSRGSMGDVIEFDAYVSGKKIDRLRGDGFVVSTATGSTGYALAAGGPVVTPEFRGMVCVPVAPHTITARAFLTAPSDIVEIVVSPDRPVERAFFADGQKILCHGNDTSAHFATRATIKRGKGDIILLTAGNDSFYNSVSRVFYGKTDA